MRKTISIISIMTVILLAGMLLSGCGAQQKEKPSLAPSDTVETEDDKEDAGDSAETDEEIQPGVSVKKSGVTQEDLDKLKEELDGMEFEDIGGLSSG